VALQQTTRELWAQQGPFEPYTIHGVPQQNIPEIYIKGAVWNAQADPPRYVAQSSAPEESETGTWFPVDFNEEHVCWVEVRLQEPAGSEAYWQAFRIAGPPPPRGGPPGGPFGPPGGGPPGGPFGPPGGGPPMPIPPAPVIGGGGRNDKLVGNTPLIFKGERNRAEEFITQWQLYEGVNITNDLMRNAYQRAMLFLTYIQGPIVNEWVKGVNAWLRGQIINQ
jgi:hypothetical protein